MLQERGIISKFLLLEEHIDKGVLPESFLRLQDYKKGTSGIF